MSDFIIYTLHDPNTFEIRYVGQSARGIKRASEYHAAHCGSWIKSLEKTEQVPIAKIHQRWEFISVEDLDKAEMYWISYFRSIGSPLTNMTDGGGGCRGYKQTPEHVEKLAKTRRGRHKTQKEIEQRRQKMIGRKNGPMPEETRKKLSIMRAGKPFPKEATEKARIVNMGNKYAAGQVFTEERRAAMSRAMTGRVFSEEHKRKIGEANKRRVWTEESRQKMSNAKKGSIVSEKTRRKQSKSMKEAHRSGRVKANYAKGEKNYNASITDEMARNIKNMKKETGLSARRIAEHFGVSKNVTKSILSGKSWRHVKV